MQISAALTGAVSLAATLSSVSGLPTERPGQGAPELGRRTTDYNTRDYTVIRGFNGRVLMKKVPQAYAAMQGMIPEFSRRCAVEGGHVSLRTNFVHCVPGAKRAFEEAPSSEEAGERVLATEAEPFQSWLTGTQPKKDRP